MKPFSNILVCLDLSQKDEALIRYAAYLNHLFEPDNIVLFHVAKVDDLPEALRKKYLPSARYGPFKGRIREEIKSSVGNYKTDESFEPEVGVALGHPFKEILKRIIHEKSDLLIVGKGASEDASLVMPAKLARKSLCSVLVVPESFDFPQIEKVLVPVDFSPLSNLAFEGGCMIANAAGLNDITVFHACSEPHSYISDAFEDLEGDYSDDSQADGEKRMKRLISPRGEKTATLKFKTLVEYDTHPERIISKMVQDVGYDLCIIGAQGKSALTAFLLGSLTEKLLRRLTIPLLIAKNEWAKKPMTTPSTKEESEQKDIEDWDDDDWYHQYY